MGMTEERKSADGKQNPDYEVEAGEVVEEEL
ncbi:MAG TPA: CDP-diacylglycerol--serine O-phosphatidyltransferase, partial [Marinobacter adhaerens]|nr:CDP-diacylglycerol--serine O-phosphatidyltransferase [Marinobacter adhaerens]